MKWEELNYWNWGEWQVIQERLDDRLKAGVQVCPSRTDLFRAMDLVRMDQVRVAFIGQDPYPNPALATGVAFSIPDFQAFPPTLVNILTELQDDLGYPFPTSGNLEGWCSQGVLLWNAIPTCDAWNSMSHSGWEEWSPLTYELIRELSRNDIVFVFLGAVARKFAIAVEDDSNKTIFVSHPSPRGVHAGTNPFKGSRIFSTINDYLRQQALKPIDWRLAWDTQPKSESEIDTTESVG